MDVSQDIVVKNRSVFNKTLLLLLGHPVCFCASVEFHENSLCSSFGRTDTALAQGSLVTTPKVRQGHNRRMCHRKSFESIFDAVVDRSLVACFLNHPVALCIELTVLLE